jgi:hypothetical protein
MKHMIKFLKGALCGVAVAIGLIVLAALSVVATMAGPFGLAVYVMCIAAIAGGIIASADEEEACCGDCNG